jgi:hypothetical protein
MSQIKVSEISFEKNQENPISSTSPTGMPKFNNLEKIREEDQEEDATPVSDNSFFLLYKLSEKTYSQISFQELI